MIGDDTVTYDPCVMLYMKGCVMVSRGYCVIYEDDKLDSYLRSMELVGVSPPPPL